MSLKPPCEMMVRVHLPHIRRSLAQRLMGRGVSQREAAEKLGLTQAAVSQYMSEKRGSEDPDLLSELGVIDGLLEDFARSLAEDDLEDEERVLGLCNICEELRASKAVCGTHLEGAQADCDICCA